MSSTSSYPHWNASRTERVTFRGALSSSLYPKSVLLHFALP